MPKATQRSSGVAGTLRLPIPGRDLGAGNSLLHCITALQGGDRGSKEVSTVHSACSSALSGQEELSHPFNRTFRHLLYAESVLGTEYALDILELIVGRRQITEAQTDKERKHLSIMVVISPACKKDHFRSGDGERVLSAGGTGELTLRDEKKLGEAGGQVDSPDSASTPLHVGPPRRLVFREG